MRKLESDILNDLLNSFDYKTLLRGTEYYNNGQVQSCKLFWHDDILNIESEVVGSRLYRQDIYINMYYIDIEGECSCPVGYNCKHVVAALLEAATNCINQKRSQNQSNNYLEWLEKIEESTNEKEEYRSDRDYFLIYRLFLSQWGSDIEFYKAKILKKGGISKGQKLSNENLFSSYEYKYSFLSQEDKELIPLLYKLTRPHNYEIVLQEELGAIALKKIVATQRAFFKDTTIPLSLSPKKEKLEFSWQDVKGGSKLSSNLPENAYLIRKTEPLFYIDTNNHGKKGSGDNNNKSLSKYTLN